jgi:uncharacterized protein with PIN domain
MTPTQIDYTAFSIMLLKWIGISLVIWIVIALILRFSNYYRIASCPNCGGTVKRSSRGRTEKSLKFWSLGILDLKRYRCYTCYWEGSALPIKNNKGVEAVEDESN